jgi:hypothetical protein
MAMRRGSVSFPETTIRSQLGEFSCEIISTCSNATLKTSKLATPLSAGGTHAAGTHLRHRPAPVRSWKSAPRHAIEWHGLLRRRGDSGLAAESRTRPGTCACSVQPLGTDLKCACSKNSCALVLGHVTARRRRVRASFVLAHKYY